MNARFGVILSTSRRKMLLSKNPRQTRSWGDEVFEVGDETYSYTSLPDVECRIYSKIGFIQSRLPAELQKPDTEYIDMQGPGVDAYEEYIRGTDFDVQSAHPFEAGLASFIEGAGICAVGLAPDNDRLEIFATLEIVQLIELLRENVRDISIAKGFAVTVVCHT